MKWLNWLFRIDRRIVFLILAVVVILPLLVPLNLGVTISPPVKNLFDEIDRIPANSKPLMISVDFDPNSMPELYPMYLAILRHAFARDVRVIILGLWLTGISIGEEGLSEVSRDFNKVYGKDYVFLGWQAGVAAVILGMGENIKRVFPNDYYNRPLDSLPLMREVRNYSDIPLFISLSAGDPGYRTWITYAGASYGLKIGTGVTAVSGADAYPYLQTGQLVGLLAGMKGGAEYENLIEKAGYYKGKKPATQAMDSQSLAHLAIMVLVILGNIGFFIGRRQK
ncbi:MAG: hypothetical protein ABIL05_04625 [candidate division WOR-3 bacterium]